MRVRNLVTALLAATAGVFGSVAVNGTAHAAPGDTADVCVTTATPDGWVETQRWYSYNCGSGNAFSPNTKRITQAAGLPAGSTVDACATKATPDGFVDVQWWYSSGCGIGSYAPNTKRIQQLTGLPAGTVVNACSSTTPPAGWVITASYYSSNCQSSPVPSYANNAYTLKRV